MRRINHPAYDVTSTLAACAASIRNIDLTGRLNGIGGDLIAAERQYIDLGSRSMLFTTLGSNGVAGQVSTDEMGRVYGGTFVKSKGTRHIYDAIKKGTANDICPLCGQRVVSTLDHYLPWTVHPALAITPINLVPSCGDCNKTKLTYVASTDEDQLLHPYFDDFGRDQWIFADVIPGSPAALRFEARPPAGWPTLWKRRAAKHFQVYGLGRLYGAHAAEELVNIRYALGEIGSATDVQLHLYEQWRSRAAAHANSWSTSAYKAWSESSWFCNGGFCA